MGFLVEDNSLKSSGFLFKYSSLGVFWFLLKAGSLLVFGFLPLSCPLKYSMFIYACGL